jgi:ABC-type polysaccharide/polyol phosphate export permease
MADGLMASLGSDSTPVVYDSAARAPLLVTEFRNFWSYRRLIRLLVVRDVLVRYKRSLLGVWWTLLNPLLTMTVLWLVFSHLFRFGHRELDGVPYVVYVLTGILVVLFFQQAVELVSTSIVLNATVLTKVYVPAEIFCLSAGIASAINLGIGMLPLIVFQIALGVGIPWTILLVPLPVLALLMLVLGLGLLVAAVAVRFNDMLDFNRVILLLIGYLTPTFYPISIVPASARKLFELNPLYQDLNLFRNLVYGGTLSTWQPWVAAFGSGIALLSLGLWVFARGWRTAVAMI